jgi:hypothetical protein
LFVAWEPDKDTVRMVHKKETKLRQDIGDLGMFNMHRIPLGGEFAR